MRNAFVQAPNLDGARAAALRLIDYYGITSPKQIVIEDLVSDKGLLVCDGGVSGAEAWLIRKGRRGIIRVSDRVREPGRRRFAIAHEFGHWERHMSISQAWLCSSDDIHAYRGSVAELEANAFAAELLLPGPMFREKVAAVNDVSIAAICRLAEGFGTTLTATAVRFVEESREDCYLIFSSKSTKTVKWFRRSHTGTGLFIYPGQRISHDSSAFGCDRLPDEEGKMEWTPSSAWFPNQADASEYEVWEESVSLGEYDTILTLLCLVPIG